MDFNIRTAVPDDAEAVHDIYGAYVDSEHVTFTVTNPDVYEYREKIIVTLKKYPFYIAEDNNGKVLGYIFRWDLKMWGIFIMRDTSLENGKASYGCRKLWETSRMSRQSRCPSLDKYIYTMKKIAQMTCFAI